MLTNLKNRAYFRFCEMTAQSQSSINIEVYGEDILTDIFEMFSKKLSYLKIFRERSMINFFSNCSVMTV